MDENVIKMLSWVSVVFLLLGAVTLFFVLYKDGTNTVGLVNRGINDRRTVYESTHPITTNTEVKGSDIVGTIKNGLETDISIDSVSISTFSDAHTFDYSLIDSASWYSVVYHYNLSGEVIRIEYRKR